jgi:TetR/AcrR family transcriptional repressor of nem operon
MDAAEKRIRGAGYSGFSFREIASDVGVKSASVHYHFPTKDALAVAVARRCIARAEEAIARDTAAGVDIVQAWCRLFRNTVVSGSRNCLFGALGATSDDFTPGVAAEVKRFFELIITSLMTGGLSRMAATQILATLEGAILVAGIRADVATFDDATAELARGPSHSRRQSKRK